MATRVSRITGEVRRQTPRMRFADRYSELAQQLRLLEAEFSTRCGRLRSLQANRQRDAVRHLLGMRHLYPAFAFTALKQTGEIEAATPQTVEELAAEFDPFSEIRDEPALLRRIGRTAGRTRTVVDFRVKRRMHQHVVARILQQLHPPPENMYLFNGGMPRALRAIEDAISTGATHACEIDFVGFYSSVTSGDLAEVMRPLPSSVVSHVVWDVSLRRSGNFLGPSGLRPDATPEPPEGLFLGSAVSPIVGEILIARLLEAAQLPNVITYADNLLVLGQSEDDVAARIQALRSVLRDPPFLCVSGLSIREGATKDVRDQQRASSVGVEFSSHESLFDAGADEPAIIGWRPSDRRLAQFEISDRDHVTVEQLEKAITRVSNWRRYYASWPDGDLYESRYLASLKARRFIEQRTPRNRASARAAVIYACLTARRFGHQEVDYREFLPGLGSEAEEDLARAIEDQLLANINRDTV